MILLNRRGVLAAAMAVPCLLSGRAAADILPPQEQAEGNVQDECGTTERWLAAGGDAVMRAAGCPLLGVCDNPGVRDQHLPGLAATQYDVSLQINVLCDDNGVCPFSPADVESAIALLQQGVDAVDLTPHPSGLSFTHRLRFINDSTYTTLTNLNLPNPDDYPMKDAYATDPAGHLNIWVTNFTTATGFRGLSTFPWDQLAKTARGGILIDVAEFNNPASGSLVHELGHALGLWHVHRGGSAETPVPCTGCWENNISWPPAASQDLVGDFCKDTRPTDPNFTCSPSINLEPCFIFQYGPFSGSNYRNYMGFSPFPEGGCRNHLTKEQAGRMRCWLQDAVAGWLTVQRDRCEDAVAVGAGVHFGTTRGFTNTGDSTCDGGSSPVDVWYRYDATSSGKITLSTCESGTSFDSQISVTTNCGNQIANEIACSSNSPGCGIFGQHGRFSFTATAGTSYYIRIANDSAGEGDYALRICKGSGPQCKLYQLQPLAASGQSQKDGGIDEK